MENNWKKRFRNYGEYDKAIKELAKGSPSAEEILTEFENGDFSSIDPEYFKTGHDILERFMKSQNEGSRKRSGKFRRDEKDPEISL